MEKKLYSSKNRFLLFLFAGLLLLNTPDCFSQGTLMPIGPQSGTFSSMVRGYYFTAPVSFTICGLYIPTNASTGSQNVEVVRFTAGTPPAYAGTTNNFISLFYLNNYATNAIIPCNILVNAGDIIGIYGARSGSMVNSYDGTQYASNILGNPVTLYRSGMQANLSTQQMANIWSENNYSIGRIEMYYNCCTSSIAADSATANPNPICSGSTTTLTVNGGTLAPGATWNWYTGSCGGTLVGTGASITVSPAGPTTYYVRAEGTCNITTCVSVNVSFSTPSTAPTSATANPAYLCGGSTTLTVNGGSLGVGAAWNWYSGSCGGTLEGTGSSITVSPTTTTTYFVRAQGGCNTTTCESVTVDVYQAPAPANAGPDAAICGSSITLTGNAASVGTGTWTQVSGPGTLQYANANYESSVVTSSTYGAYTLAWTIVNGLCSTADSVEITFLQDPAPANAGPDNAFCGSTTTLGALPASIGTGTWTQASGPGSLSFSNPNDPTASVTASLTGTYVLFWTVNNGSCSKMDSMIISFDIPPTPANAGPDKVICGQTTTLSGNTATTGTAQWVQITGPGLLVFSAQGNPGSTILVSGTPWSYGTYTMRWSISNGSCTTSDTVQITFDQPVNPADAGADMIICNDSVPLLGAIHPAIGTGEWNQVFGLGTANFSDTLFHNAAINVTAYGEYIVSWTVTNGSCSSSDTISLVFKEPATTSAAGKDQEICGLSAIMDGNEALVGQGLWTKVSGPGALSFVNVTGENSSVTASEYGSYVIRWTISNFDCISEDSLRVIFYEAPDEARAGNDTLVCNLEELKLNAVSPVVGNGKWSVITGPAILFDSTLNTTLAIDLQTGLNEFIWTNSNGVCPVSRDTISITVSKAKAEFESSRYVFFVDDVIQLTDLSSINPVEWSWTFDDGDSSFIRHPKHAYTDTGSFTITLIMENEHGCLDSLEKVVRVYKHLNVYVPNSFTPNGNGKNDEFKVYGDGISEIELLIFNRWGELIFQTRDIDTGWNGRKNNTGALVQQGVYIYKLRVVNYHGVEKKQDGTITIMK